MYPEMPTPSGPKALDLLALKRAVPFVAHQQYHSEDKPGGERAELTCRQHPCAGANSCPKTPGIVQHNHAETQGGALFEAHFLCHSRATNLGQVISHLCSSVSSLFVKPFVGLLWKLEIIHVKELTRCLALQMCSVSGDCGCNAHWPNSSQRSGYPAVTNTCVCAWGGQDRHQ